MEQIDYTLPEFAFLDANSHMGNLLKNRTVIHHIRSYTIVEVIALNEVEFYDFKMPTHKFTYTNPFGIEEQHMLVLHFSLTWKSPMPVNDALTEIFEKMAKWYCDYLAWEDRNIENEHKGFHN